MKILNSIVLIFVFIVCFTWIYLDIISLIMFHFVSVTEVNTCKQKGQTVKDYANELHHNGVFSTSKQVV